MMGEAHVMGMTPICSLGLSMPVNGTTVAPWSVAPWSVAVMAAAGPPGL